MLPLQRGRNMTRLEELTKIHASGCFMQEKDLAELYTYLELFAKTYLCGRDAAVSLMDSVRKVYSLEYACSDPVKEMRKLRNPRNAGRKPLYSDVIIAQVKQLRRAGLSIRDISAQTGIPRASVQRILQASPF